LSVFNGPFDVAAAEAVDASLTRHEIDGALESLVERSMLNVAFGRSGRRFRMLETMRQFGAESLRSHGQSALIGERHARWCLRQVTEICHLLRGPEESEGVARLGELWPNLRAGVGWASAAGDPILADALIRPVTTEITLRAEQEIGDWAEDILATAPPDNADLRAFWLLWVAERYVQNGDTAGYERVARRYGEPDRALSRFARAYASGDGAALWDCLPQAVADLHGQGEDYLAVFIEMTSAGTLLGIGRFAEVDASVSALADRYRAHGPPTLLHWALQTLAYSASFQGRHSQAERYFDEAASIDLPEGALSANKIVEARAAFRRGRRTQAFEILHSFIDEQFETDNMAAASVVCVEFINMMAAIDRRAEAAHMLSYLAAANDFGALASRTLVAEAASKIAESPGHATDEARTPTPRIDDRQALTYMREVLDHLAG
jgi:tetratricopeptide (TPR) repeat protein